MSPVGLPVAFIAGFVSFLSPCVLPIVPGFLAYLAGTSLKDADAKRGEIFLNSLFFVAGFSFVFALLGVLLNSLFYVVAENAQMWLARVGGVIIIVFGLYLARLLHIPFLEREYKIPVVAHLNSRYITSFLFGAAFAAGWTPCVGAVLGGILGLVATEPSSAFPLLFAYAIGLGIPFLVVGLFASRASRMINRYASLFEYVSVVFGIVLIILGVLVFTENLSFIANFEILNSFLLGR